VPFFFLSYARADAPGNYLYQFVADLRAELAARAGIRESETCFLDVEQPPGVSWPDATAEALATCRVFVPLYSPAYFQSEYCGREWGAFAARLRAGGDPAGLIVPVHWLPPRDPRPAAVGHIQDTRGRFGGAYREFGLRFLLKAGDRRAAYEDFLARFAIMLMTAADDHPLPPAATRDFLDAPDVFAGRPGPAGPGADDTIRIRFLIVAGRRDEMNGVRRGLDFYGAAPDQWRPYHPEHGDPIGVYAVTVASGQSLIVRSVEAGTGDITGYLERAEQAREIVILLVDSWAARIPGYGELLDGYDRRRFLNAAVLVPLNERDDETAANVETLRAHLFHRLRRVMSGENGLFREDATTIEAFNAALVDLIYEVRGRLVNERPPVRRAVGAHPVPRPQISGTN